MSQKMRPALSTEIVSLRMDTLPSGLHDESFLLVSGPAMVRTFSVEHQRGKLDEHNVFSILFIKVPHDKIFLS